jgi:uncharacterized membrane protein YjjP (DUF1212 family)
MADSAADAEAQRTRAKAERLYVRTLTKAYLHFGIPTHRLDSSLRLIAHALSLVGEFLPLPGCVIMTFTDLAASHEETEVVESEGHCSLTAAAEVLDVARAVQRGLAPAEGTRRLRKLMHAPHLYNTIQRCFFALVCSACFGLLEFGGSPIDALAAGGLSALHRFVIIKSHSLEVADIVFE